MTIQNEDSIALKYFLKSQLESQVLPPRIELIVRPECNQQCEYCYLYQHGQEIFPLEERISKDETIQNIKKILTFSLEKQIYIHTWELFAGDLFFDNIFFDIMDLFKDYYNSLLEVHPNQIVQWQNDYHRSPTILIPSNMSFCLDEEKKNRTQKYIDDFHKNNIDIRFSYSSDGKYGVSTREKNEQSDENFDTILEFCYHNHFLAHPMIAACNIDNAWKNYNWWKTQYRKYHLGEFTPFLEVRNGNEWTDEKITAYEYFLSQVLQDRIHDCDESIPRFVDSLYAKNKELRTVDSNDLLYIPFGRKSQNAMPCTLGKALSINCANLDIVICHRLAYPYLAGGHFVEQDGKIIDIEAKENVNGYLNNVLCNTFYQPVCATCEYKFFCPKGCKGAQFEYYGDYSIPIESVCKLLKAKLNFLLLSYDKLGVFDIIQHNRDKYNFSDLDLERILTLVAYVKHMANDPNRIDPSSTNRVFSHS